MSMIKQIKKAEASIIKTMGVEATFITHNNESHALKVLPKTDNTETTSKDFRTRESSRHFETLTDDIPNNWRDGTLWVNEESYNVIDVVFDAYRIRADIVVD